jgi:hypothetical protein
MRRSQNAFPAKVRRSRLCQRKKQTSAELREAALPGFSSLSNAKMRSVGAKMYALLQIAHDATLAVNLVSFLL